MKKIYSFLLLSTLLLLGVQNAWADDYYIKSDWKGNNENWNWMKMSEKESGVYEYVGYYDADDGCGWNTSNEGVGTWVPQGDLQGDKTQGYHTFTLNTNVSPATITLSEPTYVSVNVYLEKSHGRLHLYAWDENSLKWENHEWHGVQFDETEYSYSGEKWYKQTISVPCYADLRIIFNNNDSKQSASIYVGEVKSSTDLYYAVDDDYNVTYLLNGFTSWDKEARNLFVRDSVILPISGGTSENGFKVYYKDIWYGIQTYQKLTSNSTGYWFFAGDTYGGQNCGIVPKSYSGYYIFHKTGIHADQDSKGEGPVLDMFFPEQYKRESLSAGAWGTICLPGMSHVNYCSNIKIYSIASVTMNGSEPSYVTLVEEEGKLAAGCPYIFQVVADGDITINHTGVVSEKKNNGLNGTLGGKTISAEEATGLYVIKNGAIHPVSTTAGCSIGENRAYINLSEISGYSAVPGRRYVQLPMAPENATSLSSINESEDIVKFVENGRVLIRRNGVVYTTTGQIVK